jgi:hypothetical protein
MSQTPKTLEEPKFPDSRVLYETPDGPRMFKNEAQFKTWKQERWWRKLLRLTAYDREGRADARKSKMTGS